MMSNIWESAFAKSSTMWGLQPTLSAVWACEQFRQYQSLPIKVLIPGFGYGRNALPFVESGMNVTGIEVSPTAIGLCRKEFDVLKDVTIHEGSVTDMPFDDEVYDAIFCYGLIYLLDEPSRKIFLDSCFRQLAPGGLMIFSVISKQASFFGQGKCLGTDCYERAPGVSIFFYDALSAEQEFSSYGYVSQSCMDEPHSDESTMPFINVVCKKS